MNGTAVKAQGKRSVRSVVRLKAGIAATGLCLPIATSAQIATDGTVGPQVQLTGPDFDIHAELGRQVGSNLSVHPSSAETRLATSRRSPVSMVTRRTPTSISCRTAAWASGRDLSWSPIQPMHRPSAAT